MEIDFLVPAAGRGTRMGSKGNKIFLALEGKPILLHTLRALSGLPNLGRVILLVRPDEEQEIAALLGSMGEGNLRWQLVHGGAERADSVRNGLKYLADNPGAPVVMTHDAARPFLDQTLVLRLLQALETHEAAVPALPVAETTRRLGQNGRTEVADRTGLYLNQTPQAFWAKWIKPVFLAPEASCLTLTDEAGYFERLGHSVALVEGAPTNLKITKPADLVLAELYLKERQRLGAKD